MLEIDLSTLSASYIGSYSGSLCIERSTIIGIIGANGIGKSTLFNLLQESQKIDFEKVYFLGQKRLETLSPLKVKEILDLCSRELNLEFTELLNFFEFNYCLDTFVHNLSGGQSQLLKIILGLASKRSIYFFDEPFSGLSKESSELVFKYIKKLKEQGASFIIIDHDESLLKQHCSKLLTCRRKKGNIHVS